MQNLVEIKFHGKLGEDLGQESFRLSVDSVAEALKAVDTLTERKLSITAVDYVKQNVKYKILVDEKNMLTKSVETKQEVMNCGIGMERKMERIDVVPIFEGADKDDDSTDWIYFVAGAFLFGLGINMESMLLTSLGMYLMMNGLANLLSEPPEFEDFREIEQTNKKESYLFDGPINTYNPGGPVPIGYGRLLVGSLTTAYSHVAGDRLIFRDGVFYN